MMVKQNGLARLLDSAISERKKRDSLENIETWCLLHTSPEVKDRTSSPPKAKSTLSLSLGECSSQEPEVPTQYNSLPILDRVPPEDAVPKA